MKLKKKLKDTGKQLQAVVLSYNTLNHKVANVCCVEEVCTTAGLH